MVVIVVVVAIQSLISRNPLEVSQRRTAFVIMMTTHALTLLLLLCFAFAATPSAAQQQYNNGAGLVSENYAPSEKLGAVGAGGSGRLEYPQSHAAAAATRRASELLVGGGGSTTDIATSNSNNEDTTTDQSSDDVAAIIKSIARRFGSPQATAKKAEETSKQLVPLTPFSFLPFNPITFVQLSALFAIPFLQLIKIASVFRVICEGGPPCRAVFPEVKSLSDPIPVETKIVPTEFPVTTTSSTTTTSTNETDTDN